LINLTLTKEVQNNRIQSNDTTQKQNKIATISQVIGLYKIKK